jgi:hypothetical protein
MSDNEEVAGEPWLTTSEAVRRLDLSADRVRQLGRAGRLAGTPTRFGRLYARADVESFAANRHPAKPAATAEATMTNQPPVAVTLPSPLWSELIGLLWSIAWSDPVRQTVCGRLADQLYAAYLRALGVESIAVVQHLRTLPDQLRRQVLGDE